MKKLLQMLPLIFIAALLSGCPDTQLPKTPPHTPQPKAISSLADTGVAPAGPALSLA